MEESSRGLIWNQGGVNALEEGAALTQARELARKAVTIGKDESRKKFVGRPTALRLKRADGHVRFHRLSMRCKPLQENTWP
jgi:hypothetical protein